MSTFTCQVVDSAGRRQSLTRNAANEAVVVRDLNHEGFSILSIVSGSPTEQRRRALPRAVVLELTQVLATLMANGLPLKEALSVAVPLGSRTLSPLLGHLATRVSKGDSLHDAMTKWSPAWSSLYLGLIAIGEKTGDLAATLERLAEYLAGRQALRDKSVNALVYPLFVLGVAVIGVVLLATLVLPGLTGVIGSLSPQAAELYRENVGRFQIGAAVFLGGGAVVAGALWATFRGGAPAAARLDALLLRLPLVKTMQEAALGLNWSFAMEALLTSGYTLEDALSESARVVGNRRYRSALDQVRDSVIKGVPLSAAMKSASIFPEVLTGWIAVGEGSHDLVRSFRHIRQFYQKRTDDVTSRLMSLAEPGLIVVVGALLIVLILTFVTPIFSMMGNLL